MKKGYLAILFVSSVLLLLVGTRAMQPVVTVELAHSTYGDTGLHMETDDSGYIAPVFQEGDTVYILYAYSFKHVIPLKWNEFGDGFYIQKQSTPTSDTWWTVYRNSNFQYHVYEWEWSLSQGSYFTFDPLSDCLDEELGCGMTCGAGSYRAVVTVCDITRTLPFSIV